MRRAFEKLQLVNAPLAPEFLPGLRAGAYPPLHLAALATHLRHNLPELTIEILDGEILCLDELMTSLDGDIVGISCNSLTYSTALDLALVAKGSGAFVVLGGAHPTFVGREILGRRPFVDAVVCGDGEEALLGLVQGFKLSRIPNLLFRNGKSITENPRCVVSLSTLQAPEYNGIQLDRYFKKYRTLYPNKPFKRPFIMYSAKGCAWRSLPGGGCVFCAIQHEGMHQKSPTRFWEEIQLLEQSRQADFVWDVADTFTMQREWIRECVRLKPRGTKIALQVYARSTDVDEEMATLLRALDVFEVFIGIESGSQEILDRAGKGTSLQCNLRAVHLLEMEGIRVILSVVLGLPGESPSTIAETMDHLAGIMSCDNVKEVNCSILLPLPGSRAMQLLGPQLSHNGNGDIVDAESLRAQWVERFCNTTYASLVQAQGAVLERYGTIGTFGCTTGEYLRHGTGGADKW
ncbi:MAG: radical SAM protein [Candidatus Eisenbacteria bacterium]